MAHGLGLRLRIGRSLIFSSVLLHFPHHFSIILQLVFAVDGRLPKDVIVPLERQSQFGHAGKDAVGALDPWSKSAGLG